MRTTVEIKLNEHQQAADEVIEHLTDKELLDSSDRQAQRKDYKEEDAVKLVRAWRQKNYPEKK